MATLMSGTISYRAMAPMTFGFSIGMPGASEWRRTISHTWWRRTGIRTASAGWSKPCSIITTQRSPRTAFVVMIAERWMMIIGCQHYGRSW